MIRSERVLIDFTSLLYVYCNPVWAAQVSLHLVQVQDAWQQAVFTGSGLLHATSDASLLCAAGSIEHTREE